MSIPGMPCGPPLSPNSSYDARASGSDRVSYAAEISWNRVDADSSPGFLSGWFARDWRLYAFLISASDASGATPSTSYSLVSTTIRRRVQCQYAFRRIHKGDSPDRLPDFL